MNAASRTASHRILPSGLALTSRWSLPGRVVAPKRLSANLLQELHPAANTTSLSRLLSYDDILWDRGNGYTVPGIPFYSEVGLKQLAGHLIPGGVFGFWSNELPDAPFTELLGRVFPSVEVHEVDFHNPFQDRMATNTVYVGML